MDHAAPGTRSTASRIEPAAVAGEASFTGVLAIVLLARPPLLAGLPPSLTLPRGDSDTHPGLLVFGEQADGRTFFGGFATPWGVRYHELMVALPGVRWEDGAESLFVMGMTCDFWPAVWNGNFYYGFRKRLAAMRWHGDRFLAADGHSESGFDASIEPRTEETPRTLDEIRAAAAMPVLGVREDGTFVRSRFDWDFSKAAVDAVSMTLAVSPSFRELPPALTARESPAYRVRNMCWRLTWPAPAMSR